MITLLTTGSRGDIQPYLALGVELKKAGYGVGVATFENYADFVTGYGLEFFPIKGDVSRVIASQEVRGAKRADNPLKFLLSFNKLKSLVADVQEDYFNACIGAELIVYHPGAAIGYFAAQHFKVRSILATPFPMAPTREYPALIFYNAPRLGRRFNLVTHKIFEQIMWSASKSAVSQFWKRKFGRLPEDYACPYPQQNTRRAPTIISCSHHVFPRPADWPEHVHNTGYWFLDGQMGWTPPRELQDFLDGGKPPVYVGFGSIGDAASAAQTTWLVVEALQRCGQRGVLATGWDGLVRIDQLPEDIFILESAPHSWLFPQMAAVVHHGGAGTTAAALRAGVPSAVIPHTADQFTWGRRVYELGVGAKPLPRKRLSAEKLAQAIDAALSEEIKRNAKDLGVKIQSENGVREAVNIIAGVIGISS